MSRLAAVFAKASRSPALEFVQLEADWDDPQQPVHRVGLPSEDFEESRRDPHRLLDGLGSANRRQDYCRQAHPIYNENP